MNLYGNVFSLCICQIFQPLCMPSRWITCMVLCVFVCVCLTAENHRQIHILTPSVHIICFSPFLCRKPWFPGVIFFIIRVIEKKMGSRFFLFSPSDELMHLKKSFVTKELTLQAGTISALPNSLYIIWAGEGELGRGDITKAMPNEK